MTFADRQDLVLCRFNFLDQSIRQFVHVEITAHGLGRQFPGAQHRLAQLTSGAGRVDRRGLYAEVLCDLVGIEVIARQCEVDSRCIACQDFFLSANGCLFSAPFSCFVFE